MTNTERNRSKARTRVLCVGLEEDERMLLSKYQSKAGSNVTFFESTPDKAVRTLEETLFDCVLSGVNRGIESTELAKKVKAVTNVPYIMLEDKADAKMIRLAHAAGVNSIVPLGCESEDIAELFNIIEETVRGWREQRMTEAMVDVLQVLNLSSNKERVECCCYYFFFFFQKNFSKVLIALIKINFNIKIAFAILFKNAFITISKAYSDIKIGIYLRIHKLSG